MGTRMAKALLFGIGVGSSLSSMLQLGFADLPDNGGRTFTALYGVGGILTLALLLLVERFNQRPGLPQEKP